MAVTRICPNFFTDDTKAGKTFFNDVLGLETAMELDFITTYRSTDNHAVQISIVTDDPSGFEPAYSVGVDDVDAVHARAEEEGMDIVYALRDEPWGVRRFFVRDPAGKIANIVGHRND